MSNTPSEFIFRVATNPRSGLGHINRLAAFRSFVSGKCTWFIPKGNPRSSRKHRIAGILNPVGKLSIDDGALRALQSGKSLLPAGVVVIEGEFQKGDVVILVNNDADEIGRGLVAYSAADARLLMGHKSSEIENLLGYRGSDELINRDNLVLS